MRLINADALRQRMYHEAFETDTDMQKWDSGCWIRYKLFENCIDEQPTISPDDVRGVGEWIQNDNGTWSCSECHSWVPDEQHYYARFCLYCGAKMEVSEDA